LSKASAIEFGTAT